jgi:hypothetical protein
VRYHESLDDNAYQNLALDSKQEAVVNWGQLHSCELLRKIVANLNQDAL